MHFILAAVDGALADAFEKHSHSLDDVTVHRGSIFEVECDAVVSPANSFGFMDGGIDAWYTWYFGSVMQDNVRMAILRYWNGELPIGAAEIVDTGHEDIPFLIAAPTMRVPMVLGKQTINPYLAMRAVIMTVREMKFREGNFAGEPVSKYVQRIALPGLGTGVGRVPVDLAARQIVEAIRSHRNGRHYLPKSWAEACETHQNLLGGNPRNLQH